MVNRNILDYKDILILLNKKLEYKLNNIVKIYS